MELRTGPVEWDEEALKKAYKSLPTQQILQYAPYLLGGGLLGLGGRGLFNLLRDPKLESMFGKGLLGL